MISSTTYCPICKATREVVRIDAYKEPVDTMIVVIDRLSCGDVRATIVPDVLDTYGADDDKSLQWLRSPWRVIGDSRPGRGLTP